ncbi:MAG: DUF222 domain-containing protein [Actinomycetota bacterium]
MFDYGKEPSPAAKAAHQPAPQPQGPLSDGEAQALQDEVVQLSSVIAAATGKLLRLVDEYDRRVSTTPHVAHDTTQWLAWVAGMKPHNARSLTRLVQRLRELPKISAALECGEISVDKADAISRVGSSENEAILLTWAKSGTAAQLSRVMGAYKRCKRRDGDEPEAHHLLRKLHYRFDDDGFFRLTARLAPEEGAIVARALEITGEELRKEVTPTTPEEEADPESLVQRNLMHADMASGRAADALVVIAETALSSTASSSSSDRYQVVIHVDHDSLTEDTGHTCEVEPGMGISSETARRVTCDCSIVTLLEKDGVPMNMGRKRRTISPSLRRAVVARDGHCVFPGCMRRAYTQAHHVRHWTKDGGHTSLENVYLLCWTHHRLVHEGGYRMEIPEPGKPIFYRPDGEVVPSTPPAGALPEAAWAEARRMWRVSPDDWLHWMDPLDLDVSMLVLSQAAS